MKKICCSVILGFIVYFFTMALCDIYVSYPNIISELVFYYAILMTLISFATYGFGEEKEGNILEYSIFLAIAIFFLTIMLMMFVIPYEEPNIIIASYFAIISFVISSISYAIGKTTRKDK